MNSRDFQSAVFIKMDAFMSEVKEVKKYAKSIEKYVKAILPQSHLQPFSKPPQKSVGRDLNIASWFREKTKSENEKLGDNAPSKYLEFPEDVSDEQLNEDMKRCMHSLLCERLKPGWETMNWSSIYNRDKMIGEEIISEAALRPEMAVIAQSAGYWAIRTIAEQRQKSTKRAAEQKLARRRKARMEEANVEFTDEGQRSRQLEKTETAVCVEPSSENMAVRTVVEQDEIAQLHSDEEDLDMAKGFSLTAKAVSKVPDLEITQACKSKGSLGGSSDKNEDLPKEPDLVSGALGTNHDESEKESMLPVSKSTCGDNDKHVEVDVSLLMRSLSDKDVRALLAKLIATKNGNENNKNVTDTKNIPEEARNDRFRSRESNQNNCVSDRSKGKRNVDEVAEQARGGKKRKVQKTKISKSGKKGRN